MNVSVKVGAQNSVNTTLNTPDSGFNGYDSGGGNPQTDSNSCGG
jgi:hypothetical protein